MEGRAKKCFEVYCELTKVSTPCLDDHNFTKEELETVGEIIVQRLLADCLKMFVFGTNW